MSTAPSMRTLADCIVDGIPAAACLLQPVQVLGKPGVLTSIPGSVLHLVVNHTNRRSHREYVHAHPQHESSCSW